ncbi:MAG: hypothetical protein D6719_12725 [Candidatus Dadabacteria bacterium]|nr:MAG: hypothetical protein D6719_12725 [Candidatus Dadabacteria bacterium]
MRCDLIFKRLREICADAYLDGTLSSSRLPEAGCSTGLEGFDDVQVPHPPIAVSSIMYGVRLLLIRAEAAPGYSQKNKNKL